MKCKGRKRSTDGYVRYIQDTHERTLTESKCSKCCERKQVVNNVDAHEDINRRLQTYMADNGLES